MGRRGQSNRSEDNALEVRGPAHQKPDAKAKRRERNRQAQHDFRTRRQAAEAARQRRVEHLEDTIEKLSEVIIGICDDVLTSPKVVGQPGLMVRLQRSMTEALRLAQSAVDSNDAQVLIENHDFEAVVGPNGSSTEFQSPTSRQQESPSAQPTQSTTNTYNTRLQVSANSGSYDSTWKASCTQTPTLPSSLWLSAQTTLGPPHGLSDADTNQFPVQLVEATLSKACLALSDPRIPPGRLKKAFGSMIGLHCTREELLRRIRWLLGPGYSEIYYTAGANWSPSSISGFNGLRLGSSTFPNANNHESSEQHSESMYEQTQRDEFLTALEVATQLEGLGASFIGSETIELRLSEEKDTRKYSATSHTPTTRSVMNPPGLRIRLNSLLLTANLSSVAECVGFGPVYPRSQIAKAVEASLKPAKTTRCELFSDDIANGLVNKLKVIRSPDEPIIGTVTYIAAESIPRAYVQHMLLQLYEKSFIIDIYIYGGGVYNTNILKDLQARLPRRKVLEIDDTPVKINRRAKQAVMFALLEFACVMGWSVRLAADAEIEGT